MSFLKKLKIQLKKNKERKGVSISGWRKDGKGGGLCAPYTRIPRQPHIRPLTPLAECPLLFVGKRKVENQFKIIIKKYRQERRNGVRSAQRSRAKIPTHLRIPVLRTSFILNFRARQGTRGRVFSCSERVGCGYIR